MPKSCGTCTWYDPEAYLTDLTDPPEEQIGACRWPAQRLPFSLRYGTYERTSVAPVEGTECACYEPKGTDHD